MTVSKNIMRQTSALTHEEQTQKLALSRHNELNTLHADLITYVTDEKKSIESVKGIVSVHGLNNSLHKIAYEIRVVTQDNKNASMSLNISYEPESEDSNESPFNVTRKIAVSEKIQVLDW